MNRFTSFDQMCSGMHVICMHGNSRYNQTGVVEAIVPRLGGGNPLIKIKWNEDGVVECWYYPSSFAPLSQQDIELATDLNRRKEHAEKFL